MQITLLAVGSLKTSWVQEGCQQYLDRLSIDLLEVPASKQKDSVKQAAEESVTILKRLEKLEGKVWVFDERGESYTSETFARLFVSSTNHGERIICILGGAYGLSDEIRRRANKIIALSTMVFPHELCRIVLLEQIYRAQQIAKNTGYHHT